MANTLTLTDKFDIEKELLYEQFLDFTKYGKHHPVMTDVKIVSDKSPEYVEYEVNEEIPIIAFIKMYPNYKVKVFEKEKGKHIQYKSQVKPRVFLIIDIYFSESDGKINLVENIAVTGNKIITTIFLGILKKAHLTLFKNLNKNLSVRAES